MTRAVDLVISVLALAILAPVAALAALANWALTRRVLFRQTRVGRGLRPFTILKFQTMVERPAPGSTVTVAGDPRLTGLGRVLRTLKIDEVPQLINVLRGEMSLVGPRALTPNEITRVPGDVAARVYAVRPGMTGVAALLFADEERLLATATDPEEQYFGVILPRKMALESVYARRKSLWLDLLILALTPVGILFPAAARALLPRILGVEAHAAAGGALA